MEKCKARKEQISNPKLGLYSGGVRCNFISRFQVVVFCHFSAKSRRQLFLGTVSSFSTKCYAKLVEDNRFIGVLSFKISNESLFYKILFVLNVITLWPKF